MTLSSHSFSYPVSFPILPSRIHYLISYRVFLSYHHRLGFLYHYVPFHPLIGLLVIMSLLFIFILWSLSSLCNICHMCNHLSLLACRRQLFRFLSTNTKRSFHVHFKHLIESLYRFLYAVRYILLSIQEVLLEKDAQVNTLLPKPQWPICVVMAQRDRTTRPTAAIQLPVKVDMTPTSSPSSHS